MCKCILPLIKSVFISTKNEGDLSQLTTFLSKNGLTVNEYISQRYIKIDYHPKYLTPTIHNFIINRRHTIDQYSFVLFDRLDIASVPYCSYADTTSSSLILDLYLLSHSRVFYRFIDILFQVLQQVNSLSKGSKSKLLDTYNSDTANKAMQSKKVVDWGLNSLKLIHSTPLAGQYIINPSLTQVYQGLKALIIKEILFDFDNIIIPKTVPLELWYQTGHYRRFGNEFFYLTSFNNSRAQRKFKRNKDTIDNILNKETLDALKPPISGQTYAQCIPLWSGLKYKTLNKRALPLKIYDHSGFSYRNESGGLHSLERLNEFRRIELFYIIKAEQMDANCKDLVNRYSSFLKKLDIPHHILQVQSWADPTNDVMMTFDIEFIQEGQKPLELINISNNLNHYINLFQVKVNTPCQLYQGCSGIGLDRIVYVLLRRYGPNLDQWPEELKQKFNIRKVENIYL